MCVNGGTQIDPNHKYMNYLWPQLCYFIDGGRYHSQWVYCIVLDYMAKSVFETKQNWQKEKVINYNVLM